DFLVPFEGLRARAEPTDTVVAGHPWQLGYVLAYLPNPPSSLVLDRGFDSQGDSSNAPGRRIWVMSYSPEQTWTGLKTEDKYGRLWPTLFVDQFGDTRLRAFGRTGQSLGPGRLATFGSEAALDTGRVFATAPLRPG